jgi:hypothetical protein
MGLPGKRLLPIRAGIKASTFMRIPDSKGWIL